MTITTEIEGQKETEGPCCSSDCCPEDKPKPNEVETPAEGIRDALRRAYGGVAAAPANIKGCSASGCSPTPSAALEAAARLGYSSEELGAHGEANLGLGCGTPVADAQLKPGERVLDLGSGAGFDALIARQSVGSSGHVIGVDMTPQMLSRARTHAVTQGVQENVEFREGQIEDLPVCDSSVDVVLSNCVLCLSSDREKVAREAFRVLKPGGRVCWSDVLATSSPDEELQQAMASLGGCGPQAASLDDYQKSLVAAGFVDVAFERKSDLGACFDAGSDPVVKSARSAAGPALWAELSQSVASFSVQARKPASAA